MIIFLVKVVRQDRPWPMPPRHGTWFEMRRAFSMLSRCISTYPASIPCTSMPRRVTYFIVTMIRVFKSCKRDISLELLWNMKSRYEEAW
ncbi:hypothetical protein AA310_02415 [Arthrobacter sp. YC-RL1]|nr:hypothetical protein ATC04_16225 [Arthrobacter sp. YC-RL1]KLI90239.1 hypothetical protein AA310_02415 [Arthrobacter sp. YC-RL1]